MNPQEANSQNPAPQNPAPQPESQPMPNPEVAAPQTVSNPQVVPPQATPQQTPVAGKKSHAGIIIVIVLLIVLAVIGGLIFFAYKTFTNAVKSVADNTFDSVVEDIEKQIDDAKNNKNSNDPSQNTVAPDNNPIIAANNKMRNELGNFDYDAVITENAMGVSIESTMSCTFDGKNKLEYCEEKVGDILSQEVYYDYGNEFQYTKFASSFGYGESSEYWTKTAMPKGTAAGIDITNSASFSNYTSEELDGGTMYSGTFEGFDSLGDAEININGESGTTGKMNYKVFINNDGYIETIDITSDDQSMAQSLKITYKNFGTARSLSIPAEALK
jgi:type II secretory pathway pseudopilin PulG